MIAFAYYSDATIPTGPCRHNCFGFQKDPLELGPNGPQGATTPTMLPLLTGYNQTDPAWYTGQEMSTANKCSYLYDELTNFRDIGPGQAICADADGFTWLNASGQHPPYTNTTNPNGFGTGNASAWGRMPKKSNHDNGQNVMFFDGHVKYFADTVYDSRDPNDDIFCPQIGWGADTDAYVWDGGANEYSQAH